jgi:trans-2,3-dihydro-3-hydroxyanthranilate isomerase
MSHPFFIVDVFTETKYAGNQLAVVNDDGKLTNSARQAIAREMHFSETTFVSPQPSREGEYLVRIFTPATEIPFAGHPTLGSAFIIQRELIRAPVASLVLLEGVGQIPVTFAGDVVWMKQIPPLFGDALDARAIARTLNIPAESMDARFPIQLVSTGLPFVICPLTTLAAVKQCRPAWEHFPGEKFPKALLVFCPETYQRENQLNARVFVDEVGVAEDPATGSANGCLAGYLVKHNYFGSARIETRVEQGYEIARPSLLFLRAAAQDDTIEINVGGRVELIARGELV